MISLDSLNFCSAAVGNCVGFCAKQIFSYHAHEKVQTLLQERITLVAKEIFPPFLAQAVGWQASCIAALPLTSFIGDVIWISVQEFIQTTFEVAAKALHLVRSSCQKVHASALSCLWGISWLVGYVAKTVFVRYGMTLMKQGLEHGLSYILPKILACPSISFLTPFLSGFGSIVLAAPATTFISDCIGGVVKHLTYMIGKEISEAVYALWCWK